MTVVKLTNYKSYKQYEDFYQAGKLNLNADNTYRVKKDLQKEYIRAWMRLLNQK